MEESSPPESFSSCRNVSDLAYHVRNKVELCIQNYMSLDVTAKFLEKTHQISKSVTHIVWEQLREENPDFFNHFEMRCQLALQMKMFNDMLTKQAVGMFENGLLDICDASPSVKTLLRQQHPERVHLLETRLSSASLVALPYANGPSDESFTNFVAQTHILYNQHHPVLNPASFAMPNPNGPIVVQSQNPYDQQEQVITPASFAMPNPSGPSASAAQWQFPNEQLNQHLYASSLAFYDANVTQLSIPYDQQDQHLYTTNLPLQYANGPSVTQLPIPNNQQDQHLYTTSLPFPAANDPSTPTFATDDTEYWRHLIDPAEFADVGVPPPADTTINPWSLSDYTSWTDPMTEDLSIFELGGDIMSEGMDLNEQQQHLDGDFDITPPMQTDTSLHQQQAGGVNHHHHHPVSEALNNPESADVIGHNGPSESYIKTAAELVSEQPQDLNGHYQPQQNVPVLEETLQRGGRSNEKSHSKRMCTTSVDQSGRVKRHQHEPEALNNPNSGNGTQTTGVEQQRSPKARATTRSLKEWEQYESE